MSDVSILVPYYRNPKTLRFHLRRWKMLPRIYRDRLRFIIVDDGSPQPIKIWPKEKRDIDLKVYRINENIPWNVSGAKNLLVDRCETDWFLMHDIDHYISRKALRLMLKLNMIRPKLYYLSRPTTTGKRSKKSIITLFMHKELFNQVGGYDEDFAGVRGNIDLDFHLRARGLRIPMEWRREIRMSDCLHLPDAVTTDWPIVKGLTEPPVRTQQGRLRFTWRRVC